MFDGESAKRGTDNPKTLYIVFPFGSNVAAISVNAIVFTILSLLLSK